MFLNRLNENEKVAFVSLAVHAAEANEDFAIEERSMIEDYCREMGIVYFDAVNVYTMNEIVGIFCEAELSTKKIVLLEIIGLVISDGVFDQEERGFVESFAEKIGLANEDVDREINLIEKYVSLIKEISEVIM